MMEVLNYPEWPNTYIYISNGIKEKFSNPYIYGDELRRILNNTACDLIRYFIKDLIRHRILLVRILEGGLYYGLDYALRKYKLDFKIGDIDVKSRIYYKPNDIVVKDYGLCDMAKDVEVIIIGDTIASGKTMTTVLEKLINCIKRDSLFLIMGFSTYNGLNRVRNLLDPLGFRYRLIAYGGLLGLGRNLTDMTLGDKPNYIPKDVRDYVYLKLGKPLAEKLCVVGDFTNSIKYIHLYLAERIVQIWEILSEVKEFNKIRYLKLIREGIKRLMNLGYDTDGIEKLIAEEYVRRRRLAGEDLKIDRIPLDRILVVK